MCLPAPSSSSKQQLDLAQALKRREPGAVALLESRHGGLIRLIGRRILFDRRDQEEHRQDVLWHVCRAIDTFHEGQSFVAWLSTIATRAALSFRDRDTAQKRTADTCPIDEARDAEDGRRPEAIVAAREAIAIVQEAASTMRQIDREIVYRFIVNGEPTVPEYGMTLGSLRTRICQLRRKIRAVLSQ